MADDRDPTIFAPETLLPAKPPAAGPPPGVPADPTIFDPVGHFLSEKARSGASWDEVRPVLERNGLNPVAGQSQFKLETARSKAAGMDEPLWLEAVRKSIPGSSAVGSFLLEREFGQARQRIAAGKAEDKDYDFVAQFERLKSLDEERSQGLAGGLREAAFRAPAILGEAAATGGASLEARAGAGLGEQALKFAGTQALKTPLQPSLYAEQVAARKNEQGGEYTDLKNLAPPLAMAYLQNLVLGSVAKVGGGKAFAENLPSVPGKLAGAGVAGVGEQAAADVAGGLWDEVAKDGYQTKTRYGTLGDLAWGDPGRAATHASVQALTFAAFAGLHAGKSDAGKPVLDAYAAAQDSLAKKGLTRDAAASLTAEAVKPVFEVVVEPNGTREQALARAEAMPDGPIKDYATAVAKGVPVTFGVEKSPSRDAAAEPAVAPKPAGPETVEVYRGVGAGRDPRGTGDTTGDGLFYSPDPKVAQAYAGEGGTVVRDKVTFTNLLRADNWLDAKRKLDLPQATSMADLIAAAGKAGYDGLAFKGAHGPEYVALKGHASEAVPAEPPVNLAGGEPAPEQPADPFAGLSEAEIRAHAKRYVIPKAGTAKIEAVIEAINRSPAARLTLEAKAAEKRAAQGLAAEPAEPPPESVIKRPEPSAEASPAPGPSEAPIAPPEKSGEAAGPVPVKARGEGGRYFRDAESFYKAPEITSHLQSEPAAAKAMRLLGNRVVPVEAAPGTIEGRAVLRSPHLGEHTGIDRGDAGKMSQGELARLGLSEWLIHAADRNGRNYVTLGAGHEVHGIDYAESWHPGNFRDPNGGVGPSHSDAYRKFADEPVHLTDELIREVVAKGPELERLAHDGASLLTPREQRDAVYLVRQKIEFLKGRLGRPTTLSRLPTFEGLIPEEPLANTPPPAKMTAAERFAARGKANAAKTPDEAGVKSAAAGRLTPGPKAVPPLDVPGEALMRLAEGPGPREQKALVGTLQGKSLRQIAPDAGVSHETVRADLEAIASELGIEPGAVKQQAAADAFDLIEQGRAMSAAERAAVDPDAVKMEAARRLAAEDHVLKSWRLIDGVVKLVDKEIENAEREGRPVDQARIDGYKQRIEGHEAVARRAEAAKRRGEDGGRQGAEPPGGVPADAAKTHVPESWPGWMKKAANLIPNGPGKSLDLEVLSAGGIDPASASFQAHYGSVAEAVENGIPKVLFRKGGRMVDDLATELKEHVGGDQPADLLDALAARRPSLLSADHQAQIDAAEARHFDDPHFEEQQAEEALRNQKIEHAERNPVQGHSEADASFDPAEFDLPAGRQADPGGFGNEIEAAIRAASGGEQSFHYRDLGDGGFVKVQGSHVTFGRKNDLDHVIVSFRPNGTAVVASKMYPQDRAAYAAAQERVADSLRKAGIPTNIDGKEAPPSGPAQPSLPSAESRSVAPGKPERITDGPGLVGGVPGLPGNPGRGGTPGQNGRGLPISVSEGGGRTFALARAKAEQQRAEAGLPKMAAAERFGNPSAWAEAEARLAADPEAGQKLVTELEAHDRPVTSAEGALLLHRRIAVANAHENALRVFNGKAGVLPEGSPELEGLRRRVEDLLAERDRTDRVVKAVGTQLGRGLAFYRQLAREDYSLAGMLAMARFSKGGKPLTEPEQKRVERIHDEIKRADEKQAAVEADPSKAAPKGSVGDALDVTIAQRAARRQYGELVAKLKFDALPWHQRAAGHSLEVTNAVRTFLTAYDLSAVLRQGAVLAYAHPIKAARAVPDMLRAFRSERSFQRSEAEVRNRPNALLYERSGLYLADKDALMSGREEAFLGKWVDRIPGVKASERAYVSFLNRMRADTFDALAATVSRGGRPTEVEAKALANFVNVATGRGGLGPFDKAAVGLAHVFFSPRYLASRVQFMAGQPFYQGTAATRKLIAAEYARAAAGLAVFYGVMLALNDDAELSFDPRSSDFGKVKLGNFRVDPLAGFSQLATFGVRMVGGETKSSTSGKVTALRGPTVKPGDTTTGDVVQRFLRSKLAPVPGAVLDVLSGKDTVGKPATLEHEAGQLLVPISVRDVNDALTDQGMPRGAALSLLAILGMGTQDYQARPPKGAPKPEPLLPVFGGDLSPRGRR